MCPQRRYSGRHTEINVSRFLYRHLTGKQTNKQENNPLPEYMTVVSLASYRLCSYRNHQKIICFNSDWTDPEEDALYSKTPDEDTLILGHDRILLPMELRKNISACRLNVALGPDWLETTIVI